ncbi:pyridoxamine 5'-phosphate oxidase family protein [Devosia sediminis]|uniref:Pyridoxamine 5'-phosphate oxidase family protein n=1 Tax=Devosia sediminis TaxID=2798801 RepID=A0A934MM57_9HYPH|nr:pyridoxamine 5'-phosphate oxidase family protein [Devosia sediminis]MBJ3786963.1 pyridoxamine 5'-phosphate oxidase family protein [Devosia sediminis]
MKINQAFREDAGRAVLCWLATVSADGQPNVTPKELFAIHDDETLLIADILSTNSVRNIRGNPKVCVSFVDVFAQRGFKVEGMARVVAPDEPDFSQFGAPLVTLAGEAFPVRHAIVVSIARISRIWAPSYSLVPERTDAERQAEAYRSYGVIPGAGT